MIIREHAWLLVFAILLLALTGCSKPSQTKLSANELEAQGQCSCTFHCFRKFGSHQSICGKSTATSATLVSACQRAQKGAQSACGFKFDGCKEYSHSPSCEKH